jgi:hypothetical protein
MALMLALDWHVSKSMTSDGRATSMSTPASGTCLQHYLGMLSGNHTLPAPLRARTGLKQMRMRRHSITLPLGFGLMLLGGCAYHTYAPGPGMSALDLGPAKANCRLFAQGSPPDTSFQASGSPRFVAVASAVALAVGVLSTAVHENETFNNCMLSNGWQIADGATGGPTPVQPVVMTDAVPSQAIQVQTLDPPQRQSTFGNARAEQAAHARRTAEAWLVAQHILNGPDANQEKRGLYGALCDAGDRSACFMAAALSRSYE